MFILAFPQVGVLNVMGVATPESAILSAVMILRRNLLVYGLGGVALPFVGIKAIDLVLVAVGLA